MRPPATGGKAVVDDAAAHASDMIRAAAQAAYDAMESAKGNVDPTQPWIGYITPDAASAYLAAKAAASGAINDVGRAAEDYAIGCPDFNAIWVGAECSTAQGALATGGTFGQVSIAAGVTVPLNFADIWGYGVFYNTDGAETPMYEVRGYIAGSPFCG